MGRMSSGDAGSARRAAMLVRSTCLLRLYGENVLAGGLNLFRLSARIASYLDLLGRGVPGLTRS
jgi:hypothetical protein